ncbi:MAG: hypothetical protein FWC71_06665 [Defluviitaleaceae bacterium]|nr:hypothetical protein [Defluviitaleaceae bacterium]
MENTNQTKREAQAGTAFYAHHPEGTFTFEPRTWQVEPARNNWSNKVERTFITDMAGDLTEAFCIGDWHKNWSSVESPNIMLDKNKSYVFTFWLNGGENDRLDELCQFRIYLNDNSENPFIFRLNRDYIKPTKHHQGWYRYEIPFNTGSGIAHHNNINITLQFAAMDAHCAFLPDKAEFAALLDEEIPNPQLPQRHNIKFPGGYPRDSHWSHLVYGNTATPPPLHPFSQNEQNKLQQLITLGVDIESILEHMDSEDLINLLRTPNNLAQLTNLGIDIESIIEHIDSEDLTNLLREFLES